MARDEIIPAEKVEVSRRGRKMQIDNDLLHELEKVKENEAIILEKTFGKVPYPKRSTVSHQIRKHWKLARKDEPRIDFRSDGVPQVRIRPIKKAS